jgi:putative membrane protein
MRIETKISCLTLGVMAAVWNPLALAQSSTSSTKEPVSITTPSAPQGAGGTESSQTSVSKADRKLYIKLTEGNLAEVAAAKQALAKSTDQQIKTFAQHMIDDHGMALDQLSMLARNKGIELPSVPDEKHRKQAERMAELSPIEFNGQYAKAAVDDHRATLKLLDKIIGDAKDEDLKALAKKMKPKVQAHLKMALDLTAATSRQSQQ